MGSASGVMPNNRRTASRLASPAQHVVANDAPVIVESNGELTLAEAVRQQAAKLKRLLIFNFVVVLVLLICAANNDGATGINPELAYLLLLPVGFAQFLGWFVWHMTKFELGKEAWWKGVLAAFTAMLMLPSFIIGMPLAMATIQLLRRPRVKPAFIAAAEGDNSGLNELVQAPCVSFLWRCLGAALTFSTCLWLFSTRQGRQSAPTFEGAMMAAAIIGMGVVLPFFVQMIRRRSRKQFLSRPVLATVLFASTTAVLVAPFLPQFASKTKTKRFYSHPNVNQALVTARDEAVLLRDQQLTFLNATERGGLVLNVERGLVLELHCHGLIWRYAFGRLTSAQPVSFGFDDRDMDMGGFGNPVEQTFGAVEFDGLSGFGSAGFGSGQSLAQTEPGTYELPVGEYDIVVFDTKVGWGRCNFFSTTERESDPLQIEGIGESSILRVQTGYQADFGAEGFGMAERNEDPNSLPDPFSAAYQIDGVKVELGKIAALPFKRNFTRLSEIEPNWNNDQLPPLVAGTEYVSRGFRSRLTGGRGDRRRLGLTDLQ